MPLDRVPLLKVKGKGIALERASPPQGNQKGKGAFPCLSRHGNSLHNFSNCREPCGAVRAP